MSERAGVPRMPVIGVGRRDLGRFAVLMVIVNLLLPLLVFVSARLAGERVAPRFWGEEYAITWFSSIQLLLIGGVAYLNYEAAGVERALGSERGGRGRWIWAVFALGFVFLALDERFRIHENLRDTFIRPAGLFTDFRYVSPGDVVLYAYLLVGLGFAWVLFRELRLYLRSLWYFGAALAVAATAVSIDSLPHEVTRSWPVSQDGIQIYEELGEIWAQLLFLLAFLGVLRGRLRGLAAGRSSPATLRKAAG